MQRIKAAFGKHFQARSDRKGRDRADSLEAAEERSKEHLHHGYGSARRDHRVAA